MLIFTKNKQVNAGATFYKVKQLLFNVEEKKN